MAEITIALPDPPDYLPSWLELFERMERHSLLNKIFPDRIAMYRIQDMCGAMPAGEIPQAPALIFKVMSEMARRQRLGMNDRRAVVAAEEPTGGPS